MLSSLQSSKEIAIDIEHNSYRSYAGFICLMQISTREGGDWVVDCLVPAVRDVMEGLGVVFSDPGIVKVSDDVLWEEGKADFG
jgi:exosome complex exonuclease RRP6